MTIKHLILFAALVLASVWCAGTRAFEFILTPKYGPIGELPLDCYYAFPEGQITVLRPGTVLNVNPGLSDVTNSTIPTTARIECDWCVVTEWRMDDTGKSIITCEERR